PSYPSCLLNLSSLRELSLSNLYATKPFSSDSKHVLLVPSEYPNINSIMYYPFMKKIELSTTLRIEEVDMGDNAKPEVYRVKQEIIDNKVNGQYRFMSQGYILYEAEYLNLKTKKTTVFNKINLDAKGINCI
ncbi:hypothetical protein, partial [Acinetobacter towneri]|uniref:hypothetical protein n=1 Tax=Acinetobacter towneri TaxID=202956 RepID=UPI001CE17878